MAPPKPTKKTSALIDVEDDSPDEQTAFTLSTGIDKRSLKAAVWYTVAQIVQEEEIELGRSVTEPFVASLTELVYAQAENLALELQAFAAHAGRNTIREDDVKLVARKSNALQELLEEESRRYTNQSAAKTASRGRPRPNRGGGVASSSRKPGP